MRFLWPWIKAHYPRFLKVLNIPGNEGKAVLQGASG
jgi:hypothetical protein